MDRTNFKFLIRFSKEEACKHPGEKQALPMAPDKVSTVDAKRILNLLQKEKLCVTGVDMDFAKFMNKNAGSDSVTGTWNEILTSVVAYTAKDMDPNQPCQIVVSGGTANLVGVKDCVENGAYNAGFANPKLVMLNEPNDYDRTVPIGSGEYMLRVLNNLDTLEKFPQMLVQDVTQWLAKKATPVIADRITDVVIQRMMNTLNQWANNANNLSVNNLLLAFKKITFTQNEVNQLCDIQETKFGGQPLGNVLQDAINEKCNGLLSSISPVNQQYQLTFDFPSWTVPHYTIEGSALTAASNIDWLFHQTVLAYFLTNRTNNTPLPLRQRRHIRDTWFTASNKDVILSKVREAVQSALNTQCLETEGFGIPAAIMADMTPLLGFAMFQQA